MDRGFTHRTWTKISKTKVVTESPGKFTQMSPIFFPGGTMGQYFQSQWQTNHGDTLGFVFRTLDLMSFRRNVAFRFFSESFVCAVIETRNRKTSQQ